MCIIIRLMKRDMDLCRAILDHLESQPDGIEFSLLAPDDESVLVDWNQDQIRYHIKIMAEAGLVEVFMYHEPVDSPLVPRDRQGRSYPKYNSARLTWAGHEFIDNAREPQRWDRAKGVMSSVGGFSIDVMKNVLTKMATDAAMERLT